FAEEVRRLRRDVGREAARAAHRDLLPRAPRGEAAGRIDEVVLLFSTAQPAATASAARSEAAGDETHRGAPRHGDVHLAPGRQVPAGRDEARAAEPLQRVV